MQVDRQPRTTTRTLVGRIINETLGAGWRLRPLNEGQGEFEVFPDPRADTPPGIPDVAHAWDSSYALRDRPEVIYAEPLFQISNAEQHGAVARPPGPRAVDEDEDDPATDGRYEWVLDRIKAKEAWRLVGRGLPGAGTRIGHPDTGYTRHLEILAPDRLLVDEGRDFEDDDADATDALVDGLLRNPGHGTGTASVIMSGAGPPAGWPHQEFVSGVAPGAALVPIRTTRSVTLWSMRNLTRAIRYAVDRRVHVVSISLGGPVPSTALHNAVSDAEQAGVIVLAAAGNQVRFVVFPAAFDEVVAVAASTVRDTEWPGSCRGPAVDITAPGASVWRAETLGTGNRLDFRVSRGSGTSFAVAATAGVAALWLSFHGRDRLVERYGQARLAGVFKLLLQQTCRKPASWNTRDFGPGIVNAAALLRARLPAVAPALGMRGVSRRAVSRDDTGIEAVLHVLHDAPRTGAERALADLLETPDRALPSVLQGVGQELVFHLATDPKLRRQMTELARRADTGARAAAQAIPGGTAAGRRRIATNPNASRRLQRVLAGRQPIRIRVVQPGRKRPL